MFKNYLLSFWRNVKRNKLYSLINLFCLSVGITGAVFIVLFVHHELNYDTHHQNHKDIYRIEGIYTIAGQDHHLAITPFPLALALKQEYSAIREFVRFFVLEEVLINLENQNFLETNFAFADSTVFSVFCYDFLMGDPHSALARPNTIVLTQSLSEKYFAAENPMGKTLQVNSETFEVTGVIADIPSNSQLRHPALMSMSSLDRETVFSLATSLFWNINNNFTFIQTYPDTDLSEIFSDMEAFHHKYTLPLGGKIGASAEFEHVPIREARFSNASYSLETASRTTLLILGVVAIFLIVIAAVNYTNLSTARASMRVKEIGIRKVVGATRRQIFRQFISESVLMAFGSLLVSLLFLEILMPGFNHLAQKNFSLLHILTWPLVFYVPVIVLVTGILAGGYPALFVSSMRPASVLKGSKGSRTSSVFLRKALVVFQFTISIMLISGTIVVHRQLQYLQNKELGLQTRNRIVVGLQSAQARQRIESLEQKVQSNPNVVATTKCLSVPGRGFSRHAILAETDHGNVEATITSNFIDHQYLEFFEIPILEGRNFREDLPSDATSSVIVNRSAVNYFGWNDNAIGRRIQWNYDADGVPQMSVRVVGVVEDHNLLNLQHPIEPVMYLYPSENDQYYHFIIKHLPGIEREMVSYLEQTVLDWDPMTYPNISFVNRGYYEQFAAEERLGKIFAVFACVCILISFLGLFGLSSFLTQQRKQEIGIRKVLGSSVWKINTLFYKEFSMLILVSIIISLPLSWYLLGLWLDGFLYATPLAIGPFLFSALLSLIITILTVSYHVIYVSRINPVKTLSTE